MKGTLYCCRLSTRRWIYKIDSIGFPICPLYPLMGIGLSSFSNGVFKNLEIFWVHSALRRAKAFALELARAVVLTLYLLQDRIQGIVKLFPPINRLKSTSDISIPFNPKEESSFRVSLFPTHLYQLPKSLKSYLCPSLGIRLLCVPPIRTRNILLVCLEPTS